MGVALRAVADDGDFFRLDEREVCVCVVISLCHVSIIYFRFGLEKGRDGLRCDRLSLLVEPITFRGDSGEWFHADRFSRGGDEPFV